MYSRVQVMIYTLHKHQHPQECEMLKKATLYHFPTLFTDNGS